MSTMKKKHDSEHVEENDLLHCSKMPRHMVKCNKFLCSNFILKVSFQLRFLNFRDKVYFAYQDLSPYRPFQELTQIYTKQLTTSTKETFTFSIALLCFKTYSVIRFVNMVWYDVACSGMMR